MGPRQKFKMEFYLEDTKSLQKKDDIIPFYMENRNQIYVGRQWYLKTSQKLTYYFTPIDEKNHSAFLFLYIGDDLFDDFVSTIESHVNVTGKAWPLFYKALQNGIDDNYTRSALIKLKHLHEKDKSFWCMATVVENIEWDDLETDYILSKLEVLLGDCNAMFDEIRENSVDESDIRNDKIKGLLKPVLKFGLRVLLTSVLGIPEIVSDSGDHISDIFES